MVDIDFIRIERDIQEEKFEEVIDYFLEHIKDENESVFPMLFNGILNIIREHPIMNKDQLDRMKPYLDWYNEEIQEASIEIFITGLLNNRDIFEQELDFCISQLDTFEFLNRNKFLDFFNSTYPWDLEVNEEKKIIESLIKRFRDEQWQIRLKVIDLLTKILKKEPNILKEYKLRFENLIKEEDLDVIRDNLDFLYQFMLIHYNSDDMKRFFDLIYESSWVIQERILLLIGKVGCIEKKLVVNLINDLILLLDSTDIYLVKEASKTIKELMKFYPEMFDNEFLTYIIKDKIENTGEIEEIIAESIIIYEFPRFLQIFERVSPINLPLFTFITNILKIIHTKNSDLLERIYSNLVDEFLHNYNSEIYLKLKTLIEMYPLYNIYLLIYNKLNEKGRLENPKHEESRKEILTLLISTMPELGYLKMSIWLNSKLKTEDVPIQSLIEKFNIKRTQLIQILKNLIEKNLLDALIYEDKIQKPTVETLLEYKSDLFFFKKWEIYENLKDNQNHLKLYIDIKNITSSELKNINLILNYPKKILRVIGNDLSQVKSILQLEPDKSKILTWEFKKNYDILQKPVPSFIKLVILYQKNERFASMVKKLDILML